MTLAVFTITMTQANQAHQASTRIDRERRKKLSHAGKVLSLTMKQLF
jgi:hypothetical protein